MAWPWVEGWRDWMRRFGSCKGGVPPPPPLTWPYTIPSPALSSAPAPPPQPHLSPKPHTETGACAHQQRHLEVVGEFTEGQDGHWPLVGSALGRGERGQDRPGRHPHQRSAPWPTQRALGSTASLGRKRISEAMGGSGVCSGRDGCPSLSQVPTSPQLPLPPPLLLPAMLWAHGNSSFTRLPTAQGGGAADR